MDLLGGILGLLICQSIPLTSDLDTGSHSQNTESKTPGVVPVVQSKARAREGQGLALVTQPGRRSWDWNVGSSLVPPVLPSPVPEVGLSCVHRGRSSISMATPSV